MLWDIFCHVIDNFGDIGVCWRLSADLAARGQHVRLWVDDATALAWMAPGALEGDWPGVEVLEWEQSLNPDRLLTRPCADVWIEAFGCEIPEPFVGHFAQVIAGSEDDPLQNKQSARPEWINLEYLSAEPYVERSHGLPSPVMRGPARGWTKHFFYPGFSAQTGGLLREPGLQDRGQQANEVTQRAQLVTRLGIEWHGERMVSLFCYEPPLLKAVLEQLASSPAPVQLLVTPGRAARAVQALLGETTRIDHLHICYLPPLTQQEFDNVLFSCDVNFVRGEDSVLRAIWAGKPFVWHIYPQEDQAHTAKLEAFMETLQLSDSVRTLHRAWNGMLDTPPDASALRPLLVDANEQWCREVHAARQSLFKLEDLTTKLLQFVLKKR